MRCRNAAGFTLLEALVVLVIVGLVAAVLMQGVGTVLANRIPLGRKVTDLQEQILTKQLLVGPLEGVVPDYGDRPNVFKGGRGSVQGLTIYPLQGAMGVPTPFRLVLERDRSTGETRVLYAENNDEPRELLRLDGADTAFQYADRNGRWLDVWPPARVEVPQTPWLIQINGTEGDATGVIAFLGGAHDRVSRMQDMFSSALRPGN